MGNNLFGARIAEQLAKALGPGLLPFTLIKVTLGDRDPDNPSAGPTVTKANKPCRGMLQDFKLSQIDGTVVRRGDRKALILGGTLPSGTVPDANDELRAEGKTHTVVSVLERDPDAATYLLHIR